MASWKRIVARLGLELGYFIGLDRLLASRTGGIGAILKFEHVRPAQPDSLVPDRTITPQFLDRLIGSLGDWNLDIISLDEMLQRLRQPAPDRRRFVCLTFDGGYRDFLLHAYPVLARHDAPFALFAASNAADGLAGAWWLTLERIISENSRIGLMLDGQERRYNPVDLHAKRELYELLHRWLRNLPPDARAAAMADLCGRYRVDPQTFCREQCMSWQELNDLSASPLATVGSATVSYPVLSGVSDDAAAREIQIGRTVMEASLGRKALHFAYPFGEAGSFGRRHVAQASQFGLASAVTSEPGVIVPGVSDPLRLPRLTWDGRRTNMRPMRVILSGLTMAGRRPAPLPY